MSKLSQLALNVYVTERKKNERQIGQGRDKQTKSEADHHRQTERQSKDRRTSDRESNKHIGRGRQTNTDTSTDSNRQTDSR